MAAVAKTSWTLNHGFRWRGLVLSSKELRQERPEPFSSPSFACSNCRSLPNPSELPWHPSTAFSATHRNGL
jgi:hypothetical protein